MNSARLAAAFRANAGLLGHEGFALVGFDPRDVRRLVRANEIVRVRVGVYATRETWAAADTWVAREVLRARAAAMAMRECCTFSHDSAAHLRGLPFLRPQRPWVHTTEPRPFGGCRPSSGVKHHGAPYLPAQVGSTAHGRALDLARTACDLAREHGLRTGMGACDAALRRGVTREELADAVAAMKSWPGVRTVREAVDLADAGADNPGESLARLLVVELGLGLPTTQFPVDVGGRTVWLDLLLGSHGIEFDGKQKYRRAEEGGLAADDPGEVVWRERTRERAILRCGLGVSRLVWDDLLPQRWDATRERLAREVQESWALRGSGTPSALLAYADRMSDVRSRRLREA